MTIARDLSQLRPWWQSTSPCIHLPSWNMKNETFPGKEVGTTLSVLRHRNTHMNDTPAKGILTSNDVETGIKKPSVSTADKSFWFAIFLWTQKNQILIVVGHRRTAEKLEFPPITVFTKLFRKQPDWSLVPIPAVVQSTPSPPAHVPKSRAQTWKHFSGLKAQSLIF